MKEQPKILLFSRHFPPIVSGGARRPFLLAQGLTELGCQVFVIAPKLPTGISGMEVAHVQANSTSKAVRKTPVRDFARQWLRWPDPDISWSKQAAAAVLANMPFVPDWVITTSPPESIHEAGFVLSAKTGCKWAADFRDGWLINPLRQERNGAIRNLLEKRIAQRYINQADLVLAVDPSIVAELQVYGDSEKIKLLPQAAEPSSEPAMQLASNGTKLVHTGSFSLSDPNRCITPLLEAMELASKYVPDLHLHLAGRLSETECQLIQNSSLGPKITNHGVLSYKQSLALQKAADFLVLVGSNNMAILPGKYFEYLTSGKPVIAVGDAPWVSKINMGKSIRQRLGDADQTEFYAKHPQPATPIEAASSILKLMRGIGGCENG